MSEDKTAIRIKIGQSIFETTYDNLKIFPYFAAMFSGNFKETRGDIITLQDQNPKIFKKILKALRNSGPSSPVFPPETYEMLNYLGFFPEGHGFQPIAPSYYSQLLIPWRTIAFEKVDNSTMKLNICSLQPYAYLQIIPTLFKKALYLKATLLDKNITILEIQRPYLLCKQCKLGYEIILPPIPIDQRIRFEIGFSDEIEKSQGSITLVYRKLDSSTYYNPNIEFFSFNNSLYPFDNYGKLFMTTYSSRFSAFIILDTPSGPPPLGPSAYVNLQCSGIDENLTLFYNKKKKRYDIDVITETSISITPNSVLRMTLVNTAIPLHKIYLNVSNNKKIDI